MRPQKSRRTAQRMFRKFGQAFGAFLLLVGILWTYQWVFAALAGVVSVWLGLVMAFCTLGFVGGLGMLLIFFDPQKVIQNYFTSFHRLVQPREERRSFADRIGVGDDDD